jgi:DedD protein
MAAPDDANLDELRRRARRRLVGAIVLALAVAVFVPMLLESDPKPLGEDVSVKIPPVDEGKFVNRLSDKGKIDAPKTAAKAEPKAEAPKPVPVEPPRSEPPKEEPAKVESPAKAEAPPKPEAPKEPPAAQAVAKAAPEAAVKESPPAETQAKESPKDAASGEFSVQVFAFSDDKGANSLVNKLKGKGFPAYSEPVSTSRGTLWRVRVGPYPSRDGASAAREKLKGEGYNGIVAAAK